MRRIAVSVLVGALLAVAGVVVAGSAAACSCAAAPGAGSHVASADAVFTGRLVSREVEHPSWPVISSGDPALHVFAVERVFKGAVHQRQGVVTADSGASCGLELSGEGPFVVFATRSPDAGDGRYTANLCGGTTTATPELEAELAALVGPGSAGGAGPALLPGEDATDAAGPGTLVLLLGAAGVLLLLLTALRLRRSRGGDAAPATGPG